MLQRIFSHMPLSAIGETADEQIPIFRSPAADHAMVLRCEESKHSVDKSAVVLPDAAPLPSLSSSIGSKMAHAFVTDIMPML